MILAGVKPFKTYNGGKHGSGVYQKIINQIPPHKTYIELCLGIGGIFSNKRRADTNILVDVSPGVIEAWLKLNIPDLTLVCQDAGIYLQYYFAYNNKETFIYCDPPYPKSTRKSDKDLYDFEMTDKQHEKLLQQLVTLQCNIAISSYKNDLYDKYLTNWRSIEFQAATRKGMATECLYMNYAEPTALHDYRYIGNDYRQRERIKNKTNRAINKLRRLPLLERKALLSAIQQNF